MTTSIFRRYGALKLPTTIADAVTAGTLEPLDPWRDILLGLFKQAIISELGTAWNTARTGTVLAGQAVVADTWPGPLTPDVMQVRKNGLPMLAVYRTGAAVSDERTIWQDQITQTWTVDYVLGPLSPEDQRKLRDALIAVPKVIGAVIKKRGHPDYDSGALQFFEGQFSSVRMTGFEIGQAPFGGGDSPLWHAVSVSVETVETDDELAGDATPLEGFSVSVGIRGPGGTLPDAIHATSDTPIGKLTIED